MIGIGGTVGAIGGMIFSLYIGKMLDGSALCADLRGRRVRSYFVALLSIHLLTRGNGADAATT